MPELELVGGTTNRGQVFRVGDTVRRPAQRTDGARALLAHLERVGFAGAPRWLGIDEQGREVLSYIPGEAVTPPYPAWAMADEALMSVAALLRDYHEAVEGFDGSRHSWPVPLPDSYRTGLVSHNDPNLDNIVFRDGRAVALIDFDLAAPGSALWDVAAATRLWSPLRDDVDIDEARRGRSLQRFRRFVDAYGLGPVERSRLPEAVVSNHDWCYAVVEAAVHRGHEAFTETWLDGTGVRARRTREWYARSLALLRTALD